MFTINFDLLFLSTNYSKRIGKFFGSWREKSILRLLTATLSFRSPSTKQCGLDYFSGFYYGNCISTRRKSFLDPCMPRCLVVF